MAKGIPKTINIRAKNIQRYVFFGFWSILLAPKFRRFLRRKKVDPNKIVKLKPKGRPPSILGTGPAECADRAEALELAS